MRGGGLPSVTNTPSLDPSKRPQLANAMLDSRSDLTWTFAPAWPLVYFTSASLRPLLERNEPEDFSAN
jgi:hypothetical protein